MYEVLLVGGVLLWVLFAFLYVRSGQASVFHPATYYLFFHGLVFTFRPILAYLNEFSSIYRLYQFDPPMDVKIMALVVADVGFIFFMTVLLRVARAPLVLKATARQQPDEQRRYRWFLIPILVVVAPIGIAGMRYLLTNGVTDMDLDLNTGIRVNTTTNGYFVGMSELLGVVSVLVGWQFRFRLLPLLPFLGYVVARMAIGGVRWTFLLTSAALGLFYLYDRRRRWPTPAVLAIGLGMLVLFAVIGQQRDFLVSWWNQTPRNYEIFQDKFMEGLDFGNLEFTEYLVWAIPQKTGTFGYFLDNLQLFTEPVPRVLWSGKPIGAPIQLWNLFNYGFPIGMTNSLPGEGWAQLGLPGVAIWCSLAAYAYGKFYNWFARSEQTCFQVGLYLLLMPLSVQVFRDGILLSAAKFSLWFIVAILVWRAAVTLFGTRVRRVRLPVQRAGQA